jgi:hypothetical protein
MSEPVNGDGPALRPALSAAATWVTQSDAAAR